MTKTSARDRGLYGKRPPKRHPAISLGPLLTGSVPGHPVAADYLARLADWLMLGNDVAGDCVSVTWANFRRLVTAVLGPREQYPSQDWVWQVYRTQNPSFDPQGPSDVNGPGSEADGGMDIQTLLEYLVKTGGPDGGKAVAFAKVDYTKPAEVKAAIAIFGAVWTGIKVTSANEAEFDSGQPWDYKPRSVEVGLHSILVGGYGPEPGPALGGDEKLITWGQETSFTDAFWSHQVDECWVVIWPEHGQDATFLAGVDKAKLEAAYTDLTGKTIVWPDTPPAPVPADADEALAQVLMRTNDAGQMWIDQRHDSYNAVVAKAGRAWLTATGFLPLP